MGGSQVFGQLIVTRRRHGGIPSILSINNDMEAARGDLKYLANNDDAEALWGDPHVTSP